MLKRENIDTEMVRILHSNPLKITQIMNCLLSDIDKIDKIGIFYGY